MLCESTFEVKKLFLGAHRSSEFVIDLHKYVCVCGGSYLVTGIAVAIFLFAVAMRGFVHIIAIRCLFVCLLFFYHSNFGAAPSLSPMVF